MHRNAKAFTLVELLVVTAIITILAALLLPVLARSKAAAFKTKCINNESQIVRAWHLYSTDNQGILVTNIRVSNGLSYTNWIDYTNWATGVESWRSVDANTNPIYLQNAALGAYIARNFHIYKCPADNVDATNGIRLRSYSMNGWVANTNYQFLHSCRIFLKETDFTKPGPAQTFVITDEHPDSMDDTYFDFASAGAALAGKPGDPWTDCPASYHSDGCCVAFADGHVEYHKWQDRGPYLTIQPVRRRYPLQASGLIDWKWLAFRTTAFAK